MNLLELPWLMYRSGHAARLARARGSVGMEFDRFGRGLGRRLLARRPREALRLMLNPVSILRYFEFDFTWRALPKQPGACLDLSSPRLFALYVASRIPGASVLMLNPDRADLDLTRRMIDDLGRHNISTRGAGVDALVDSPSRYDCAWSISVIEHIAGPQDDGDAVEIMSRALKPGGLLALTVPVDRRYWEEYRDVDYYGTQSPGPDGRYFFQRYYDRSAIEGRLLARFDGEVERLEWFGEAEPGRFVGYEREWQRRGLRCTVQDPAEIALHYRSFPSWEAMPGKGVCGLLLRKPAVAAGVGS